MKLPQCQELLITLSDGVLTITLNRPHKKNAMNLALVEELMSVVETVKNERSIRVIVIKGAENNFCSGGDISGMNFDNESSTHDPMWLFNRTFGQMITLVNNAPQVVITLLEGAVLGGGIGLASISDVAIADINTKFAMPETRLGIVPAQIAPFVVSRIGLMQTRRLTLLGEHIYGEEAKALGFVHYVTQNKDELENQLKNVIDKVMLCAPEANALTKKLILEVGLVEHEQLLDDAASYFCNSLKNEGKEGTAAFLQKRSPSWAN